MIARRVGIELSRLGDELLIEILTRLGPESKYAVQCKSVSKLWLSILNTSCFIRQWHQINQNNQGLILLAQYMHNRRPNWRVTENVSNFKGLESFDFLWEKHLHIVATYKDLVLYSPFLGDRGVYYLYNPFTKQSRALPPLRHTALSECFRHYNQVVLIVYDDDYYDVKFKVLRIIPRSNKDEWKTVIFSSDETKAGWRLINGTNEWPSCSQCDGYISYHGMLVWHCKSHLSEEEKLIGFTFNSNMDVIVNHTNFSFPAAYTLESPSTKIGVFQGRLRLAQWVDAPPIDDFNPNMILKVWQLDERREWELLYELDFRQVEESKDCLLARSCLRDYLLEETHWRAAISIQAFHPYDGDILYVSFEHLNPPPESQDRAFIFLCNVNNRTLELIQGLPGLLFKPVTFSLLIPSWPTPLSPQQLLLT